MTPQQFEHVQRLFLQLRDATTDDRDERLAAEDEVIRAEVLSLLQADGSCGAFLEAGVSFEATANSPSAEANVDGSESTRISPRDEREVREIGPYRILQKIGEGGFGAVYMAEQHEPIHRKVAIKLVKPGMDSKQVLARFQAERQALALMDHASIAKIFDVGTTQSGLPYFVMELVRGVPIDEFCDQQSLGLQDRLQLFRQVCEAVHHAHRKGIIHRDLKPSNVLVGMGESEPIAKVIDFGIAKALDARLTDATLFTEFGQMVGTLEYMSPEQAEMSAIDVDTRTDVYSLGVLLYRLLTGATPISKDELLRKGMFEIPRLIRETEPLRPSSRVTTQHSTSGGSIRNADMAHLQQGDLDWITMKCLSKDRRERYDSARELSSDIDNFTRGLPVTAHPPSVVYRVRKFVRRNRIAVMLGMIMLGSSLLGIAGLAIGESRARKALRQSEENLENAQEARFEADLAARLLAESIYSELVESAWRAAEENNQDRATELLDSCATNLRGWEWNFVRARANEKSETALRSSGLAGVTRLGVDASGRYLACTLVNGNVELRDLRTQRVVREFDLETKISTTTFSRDHLVIGTAAGDLHWYRLEDWTLEKEQSLGAGGIYDIEFTESEDRYAVATGGAWIKIFDKSNELQREWKLAARQSKILFDDSDGAVIGAGLDGQLYRCRLSEAEYESWFISSSSLNGLVRVSDQFVGVLTSSAILQIDLRNPDTTPQELLRTRGIATSIANNGSGSLMVGNGDGRTTLHDLQGNVLNQRALGASVGQLVWDNAGERFLVGLADGRIVSRFPENGDRVKSGVTTDGQIISQNRAILVDDGGWLHVNRLAGSESIRKIRAHQQAIWNVAVDAGEKTVVTIGEDAALRAWNFPQLTPRFDSDIGWGVRDTVLGIDGDWLAGPPPSGDDYVQEGTIGLWDAESGECIRELTGHTNWVLKLVVSENGRYLISGSEDGTTRVWDTTMWRTLHTISPEMRSSAEHLVADNNGRLYIGHRDGWITCWNLKTGQQVAEWAVFGDALTSMSLTRDGRLLATSRSGENLKVLLASTGERLVSLNLGVGYVRYFAVSQDGRDIVWSGKTGTKRVVSTDVR